MVAVALPVVSSCWRPPAAREDDFARVTLVPTVLCPLQAGIVPYPGRCVTIASRFGLCGPHRPLHALVWVHPRFTLEGQPRLPFRASLPVESSLRPGRTRLVQRPSATRREGCTMTEFHSEITQRAT